MNLDALKDRHKGQEIYVLGSGPTLGYFDPYMFVGKIVVATNRVAERLGLYRPGNPWVYTHTHYHDEDAYPLAEENPRYLFITPEGEQGYAGQPTRELGNVIHYPHRPTTFDFDPEAKWALPGGLVVGSTSIHGSMHLAAHLGAATIWLVGADCGTLDGATNHEGYQSGNLAGSNHLEWLQRWDGHLVAVANRLRADYRVGIHSLSPFVNPNLEGHKWEGTRI